MKYFLIFRSYHHNIISDVAVLVELMQGSSLLDDESDSAIELNLRMIGLYGRQFTLSLLNDSGRAGITVSVYS